MVIPEYYIENGKQIFHNLTAEAILRFQACVDGSSGVSLFYECVRRATVAPDIHRTTVVPEVRRARDRVVHEAHGAKDDGRAKMAPDIGRTAVAQEDGRARVAPEDGRATVVPDDGRATVVLDDGRVAPEDGKTRVVPETNNLCFPIRLGIGLYYYHIVRWLRVIPKEQFLFLRTEDLSTNPYSTMEKVWSFLGLSSLSRQYIEAVLSKKHEWNSNDWIRSEEYRDKFSMLPETEAMLREFYRPHNELLAKLLSDSNYNDM